MIVTESSSCPNALPYYSQPYWAEEYLTDATVNTFIDDLVANVPYYPALMYFDDPGWGYIGFSQTQATSVTETTTLQASASGAGVSYSDSTGMSTTYSMGGATGAGGDDCTSTTCPLNLLWWDRMGGSYQTWWNDEGVDFLSINTYPEPSGQPWAVSNSPTLMSDPYSYPNDTPADYTWIENPGYYCVSAGASRTYTVSFTEMKASGYGVNIGVSANLEGVEVAFSFGFSATYSSSTSNDLTVYIAYPTSIPGVAAETFGLFQEYDLVDGQYQPGPLHLVPIGSVQSC
jgi:hypothetical protein